MSNKEKFEGMKRGLIENNERKYGAEARDRWGNAAAEDANRKILKLSKAQFDRFQSLEREIGSVLGRAGDDRLAPRPAAPGAPHAPRAEVALVGLDLAVEGAVGPAGLRNAGAGHAVVAIGRVAVGARRGGRGERRRVGAGQPRQLPELALREVRVFDVLVLRCLLAAHGLILEPFRPLN